MCARGRVTKGRNRPDRKTRHKPLLPAGSRHNACRCAGSRFASGLLTQGGVPDPPGFHQHSVMAIRRVRRIGAPQSPGRAFVDIRLSRHHAAVGFGREQQAQQCSEQHLLIADRFGHLECRRSREPGTAAHTPEIRRRTTTCQRVQQCPATPARVQQEASIDETDHRDREPPATPQMRRGIAAKADGTVLDDRCRPSLVRAIQHQITVPQATRSGPWRTDRWTDTRRRRA